MEAIKDSLKKQFAGWLNDHDLQENILQFDTPRQKEHGDLTTNVALRCAKKFGQPARAVAQMMVTEIAWDPTLIKSVDIAGPGFINFFIQQSVTQLGLQTILTEKSDFGKNDTGNNKKVLVEFVSANPTGPLTIGHGRQAVLGDTIARLFEWQGYTVEREYYFNNAGRQMRILGESVQLRARQQLDENIEFPETHYQGEYIRDIARLALAELSEYAITEKSTPAFKDIAEREIFKDIQTTLKKLGIDFQRYFNEKSLYDDGKIEEVLSQLSAKGLIYQKEDATWFKMTELGFEQDKVLVKNTGEPTYRLPDMAYHQDKFRRGYDVIVDLFGADHIATYPDVVAAMEVLGWNKEQIKVLIHQFVTLYEGQEIVKMSTRKANFVTLDELIDKVGTDATRFFFLMRHMNSHLNFDIQIAQKQSDENPVFYCQYAHARICSIFRTAADQGVKMGSEADPGLLTTTPELELIKHLLAFPKTVEGALGSYEPHRITSYLTETATRFHRFYQECRVITEDADLTQARMHLLKACQIVLQNGFAIIGVHAPEKM
jgi:arginyl-tRNA synthetase